MLEFILYDKHRQYRQTIVPNTVHAEVLANGVSFAELTFDEDDKAWTDLGPGARVKMLVEGSAEEHDLYGPVVNFSGSSASGLRTVKVEDDFRMFRGLGWPNPDQPITSQTSEYHRYVGATETVVKAACSDLSERLDLGWTVAPDMGLGSVQRVEFRMHPLVDKLVPLLDADGLIWTIRDGVIDVREGVLFPRVLTPDTGIIGDYSWSITAPEVTRVVVGGEGEGAARLFQAFVDVEAEAEWGFVAETMKDARMAQGVTDLSPDGREALAEGAARASVTADLIESSWFKYGEYRVGDLIQVQVGPVDTVEAITQVVIDDTPDEGLTITPHLGAIEDDGDGELARQVARLSAAVRDQRSSR